MEADMTKDRFIYTPLSMETIKSDPQIKVDRTALAAQWRRMRSENRKIANLIFKRTKSAELQFQKQMTESIDDPQKHLERRQKAAAREAIYIAQDNTLVTTFTIVGTSDVTAALITETNYTEVVTVALEFIDDDYLTD